MVMDQQRILDDVVTWASADDNVRLVVLTGSIAGVGDSADSMSDLDIEMYVRDPAPLLGRRDWYKRFGRVLVVEELEDPDWHPTRLIYYVDGKIDFMIAPVEAVMRGIGYTRVYRVLIDKDALSESLHTDPDPAARPATAGELEKCINWFYAAALVWAKAIARDEPWSAKVREWDANNQLLHMIEWDHKARYGREYDTWHLGVHMRAWMDPEIVSALEACWADFSSQSMRSALSASVALFDRVSSRVSTARSIEPFESRLVREEIDRILG